MILDAEINCSGGATFDPFGRQIDGLFLREKVYTRCPINCYILPPQLFSHYLFSF